MKAKDSTHPILQAYCDAEFEHVAHLYAVLYVIAEDSTIYGRDARKLLSEIFKHDVYK